MTHQARKQEIKTIRGLLSKLSNPPVPIEDFAKELGIQILSAPNKKFSGALLKAEGKYYIGINSLESSYRQRFSIAHEIAHYILHSNHDTAFFDEPFEVFMRDEHSSTGTDRREIEANQLAAQILMPRPWVEEEFRKLEKHAPEEQIKIMASKFDVSEPAMTFRMLNLALKDQPGL